MAGEPLWQISKKVFIPSFFLFCRPQIWVWRKRDVGCGRRLPGLPDGIFSKQKSNLGKFWRALERKRFVYSMATWNILRPSGICFGHLVHHLVAFWHIFLRFGILYPENSGNPGLTFPGRGTRRTQKTNTTAKKFWRHRKYFFVKRALPGLPDGFFSDPKSQFGHNFWGSWN
jgi:hypothetical protein